MKKNIIDDARNGRIHIEYLDKHTVQVELDDDGCKFLIEVLTEFLNDPKMHHVNYDSDTGYSCGFMTKNSLGLIINHRGKYNDR